MIKHRKTYTKIQVYSPANVDDRVDREGENKEIIKQRNMYTIIQYYSHPDVDDKVDREGEKK